MGDDFNRIYEALGRLTANVENLSKSFQDHKEDTTVELRKVHDIVVAMSEAARNLTRRIEAVEPVATEFREGQIEQRGVKRFLVAAYTTAGGVIVFALGKAWDWYMARPHIPAIVIALLALAALTTAALAQEHHHPTETITGATAKFYETWMRPDAPSISCCNLQDCYATPARMTRGGKLQALHRESGDWIDVPADKVEKGRDSPDGRNHLCASSYKFVFCFIAGAGG